MWRLGSARYLNILLIIILMIFFAFFGYATYNFPMRTDDYTYRYVFGTDRLVESFGDVIESQINHWLHWGGRFVAHTCVQTFLCWGKAVFALLNTICYAVCCLCFLRWGTKSNKIRFYLLVALSFWLMMPSPHSCMFWLTGSCNYLWSCTSSALFLFFLFSENKDLQKLALFVGFFAGNGHESVGVAILASLVLYACLSSRRTVWFYAGIAVYLLGLCSNIVAPGNYFRMTVESAGDELPVVYKYVKNFLKVGWRLTFYATHPGVQCCTCIWVISLLISATKIRKGNRVFILPLCFLMGAASSVSLNVVTGISGPTSVFGFCFASYIAFCCVLKLSDFSKYELPVLLGLILVNAYMIPRAYADIMVMRENVERAEEACRNGYTIACATPEWDKLQKSVFASRAVEPCTLMNRPIERYMGVKDISLLKAEEYSVIANKYDELMKLDYHQVAVMDNGMEIVKLKNRPKSFHMQVDMSEKSLNALSAVEKLMHFLNKFKRRRNEGAVISLDGVYFVYWMNTSENKVSLTVSYTKENPVLIEN